MNILRPRNSAWTGVQYSGIPIIWIVNAWVSDDNIFTLVNYVAAIARRGLRYYGDGGDWEFGNG